MIPYNLLISYRKILLFLVDSINFDVIMGTSRIEKEGKPTATPAALNIDVILTAQARRLNTIVVTNNVRHLASFVDARPWRQID